MNNFFCRSLNFARKSVTSKNRPAYSSFSKKKWLGTVIKTVCRQLNYFNRLINNLESRKLLGIFLHCSGNNNCIDDKCVDGSQSDGNYSVRSPLLHATVPGIRRPSKYHHHNFIKLLWTILKHYVEPWSAMFETMIELRQCSSSDHSFMHIHIINIYIS